MNFGNVYGIILVFVLLIGIIFGKNHLKIFLLISDVVIAIPAYSIRPANFVFLDTVRFEYILNQMRSASAFSNIFAGLNWGLNQSQYSNQPLDVLYLWLFSFFKSNGVLFFTTTFLFLLFLSLLLLNVQKYFEIKEINIVYIYIIELTMFNLLFEIEGIRNFLSFMILAWALFNDMVRKKKLTPIVAYIFCALFHPMSLVFIGVRFLLLVNKRILEHKLFNVIIILLLVFYNFFTVTILDVLNIFDNVPFISMLLSKAQMYLYGQSSFSFYAGIGEILFTSLILLMLIFEYFIFKYSSFQNKIPLNYLRLYTFFTFFTIGSFLNMQIYLRSIMLLLFISIPIKSLLFENYFSSNDNESYVYLFYKILTFLLCIIMFMYWYQFIYTQAIVF